MNGCDVVTIGNPVVDVVTIGEPYCPQVKTFVDRLYELAVAQGYTPNGIGAHLPYIGTATTSLLVLCAEGISPWHSTGCVPCKYMQPPTEETSSGT